MNSKELKVIDAATGIFLRFGYKRATMADIADAVGISRPSLYLIFPNKEEIFKAIIRHTSRKSLEAVREALKATHDPRDQLIRAFECWVVAPYITITSSADAAELMHFARSFCYDIYAEAGIEFQQELATIMQPHLRSNVSARETAQLLRAAVLGCKELVTNVDELRSQINRVIEIFMHATFDQQLAKAS